MYEYMLLLCYVRGSHFVVPAPKRNERVGDDL